jgi:hypothetical protein
MPFEVGAVVRYDNVDDYIKTYLKEYVPSIYEIEKIEPSDAALGSFIGNVANFQFNAGQLEYKNGEYKFTSSADHILLPHMGNQDTCEETTVPMVAPPPFTT